MGATGTWGDGSEIDPEVLAQALGLGMSNPKATRARVMQSSLRQRAVTTPIASRPNVAPMVAEPAAQAPLPAGPDWNTQRAQYEAKLEELNQPKDLSALKAEGKRRGAEGQSGLLMALAAQQAGPEYQGIQQHMLQRAMAARDPLKFSGGIVNPQGDVIEDPGYKEQEQRAMYERRLAGIDRGENAAAIAAAERQRRAEAAAAQEALRRDLAGQTDQRMREMQQIGLSFRQGQADQKAAVGPTSKPLPRAVIKELGDLEDKAASMQQLSSSFKPEFAGMSAGLKNMAAPYVPGMDDKGSQFWKDYKKQSELVERHELFGATLTGTEKSNWDAADVNQFMQPETIAKNLGIRANIARKVFANGVDRYTRGGYPGAAETFDAGMPRTVPGSGGAGAPAPAAPAASAGGGGLSPAEQSELDQLRSRFGKR